MKAIRPGNRPSLPPSHEGADQNQVSSAIRRFLILALAAALLGALTVPLAGADGPAAVAAKKGKCKKKGAKKSGKKGKKCKRSSSAAQPGLPGTPLSPGTPTTPTSPVPLTVSDLTLTDNPVLAETSTSGEVTISDPAPAGGKAVALQSGSGRADVPDSVNVAAGETTAGFSITTSIGPTVFVPITASLASSSQQVILEVVAEPSVESVALDHNCFPAAQTNFGASQVTTDVPVPADTTVDLSSDNELSLITPSTVVVPEGASSAPFGVDTFAPGGPLTVTAELGSSTETDTASVRDAATDAVVTDLSLNPSTVPPDGSSIGTVTLDCEARAGGEVVTLSDDHLGVTTPPSVTVLEGDLSATFTIDTAPDASGTAEITATRGDSAQATLLIDQLGT